MFHNLKKLPLMLLLCLLAAGLITTPTNAAAKKTKSKKAAKKTVRRVKDKKYTMKTRGAEKNAITLQKGTTYLKFGKKGYGYVKFTAPSTREYIFTVSKLKKHKKSSLPGKHYFSIMTAKKKNPYELKGNKVKTNGGKSKNLYFWTRNIKLGSAHLQYRKKRYGRLVLEQGQTAYVYFCCSPKDSLKLRITSKAIKTKAVTVQQP